MDGMDGGTVAGIGVGALLVAAWNRIISAPDKVAALETRVKSLEERIDAPMTGLVSIMIELKDSVDDLRRTLLNNHHARGG